MSAHSNRLILIVTIGILLPSFGTAMTAGDLDPALGVEKICADLLKDDYSAASAPIVRKTAARILTFASVINWLARVIPSPYVDVPRSPLFQELPKDQGALKSCRSANGFSIVGDEIFQDMYLEYPQSRLTVSLRYAVGTPPALQFIQIGKAEPKTPNQAPQDDFQQKMENFAEQLNHVESRSEKAASANPSADVDDTYRRWLALEGDVFSLIRKDAQSGWTGLKNDSDQLVKTTGNFELTHTPSRSYSRAIHRCAVKLNDIVSGMINRQHAPGSYTDNRLAVDLGEYKNLKLTFRDAAFVLNDAATHSAPTEIHSH
jgi:hypothetical protein